MKILVPVDGSEPALDAVRHALQLKREGLKATFVLATVQEPTYVYEMMLAPDADVLERVTGAVGSRARCRPPKRCSTPPESPMSARLPPVTRPTP